MMSPSAVAVRRARVYLDLTPYVRGPSTGIGRSAYGTYLALERLAREDASVAARYEFRAVQRGSEAGAAMENLGWWRSLRGERGAILHTFDHKMPPFWAGRRLLTFHDAWTLWPNEYQDEKFRARQAPKLRKALARAHGIVTPTRAVAADLARVLPQLAAFVEAVAWGRENLDAPVATEEASPAAKPFVAIVGIVEPRKNTLYAIESLARLPDLNFVVVGAPGFRGEEIFAQIRARFGARVRCVRSLGEAARRRLYAEAEAVVLPSKDEGFGLVSVEAAAEGARVLLSDIPPFREILPEAMAFPLDDGGNRLLAMLTALRNDPDRAKAYGSVLREASRRFTWEATARGYLSAYDRLRA